MGQNDLTISFVSKKGYLVIKSNFEYGKKNYEL